MPALSPLGNRLLQGLQAKHRTVVTTRPQCVVELPETWAAYLSQLSSKERGDVGLRTKFSQVSLFKVLFGPRALLCGPPVFALAQRDQ